MKLMQPSFAKGEISPLLHARVDLAMYQIGLAYLLNMIVLPQGGVTRRPGFVTMGEAFYQLSGETCPVRLIPFIYNTEDAMMLEFGPTSIRFWTANGPIMKDGEPYQIMNVMEGFDTIRDLRFAQSGNTLFLTHRNYAPQMLIRHAVDDWEFKALAFEDGPWQPTDKSAFDTTITVEGIPELPEKFNRLVPSEDPDDPDKKFFTEGMRGSLFKLEYTVEGYETNGTSTASPGWTETESIEVGDQFYLETHGKWTGRVQIQKSLDGGETWLMVRDYTRKNADDEGQLMFSGAETERYVLYRVRAQHNGSTQMTFELSATGYTRSFIYRLGVIHDDGSATGERVFASYEKQMLFPFYGVATKVWALGSWNNENGYPGAIAFYQNRLALGGSRAQPLTLWMSRTGDYKNFSISDPVRDDDAIVITIDSDDMDGIHSLLALEDILVFTRSGEHKITGSGDYGAIAPNAIVAHKQPAKIGSAGVQPIVVNNRIVLVQTHRTEVHALGYSLSDDGYLGSNISLWANHLFEWKTNRSLAPSGRTIRGMAYQQVPDSVLWFVLEDGTAVTCTYQAEQEMAAWARQETAGIIGDVACMPVGKHSELWAAVRRGDRWMIEKLAPRAEENVFLDAGSRGYESGLRTLRVVYESQSGASFSSKKLISRLYLYGLRSEKAWVAPATNRARNKRRLVKWDYEGALCESNLQLDSGFETDAAVQIWVEGQEPLTILGISPVVTPGN